MNKINFENLPSTNTPISAENLNQLQDNVENAIVDDLTTEDAKKALSANQGRILKEKIDNNSSYSTEEQVIGRWIDGREIYRKVVNFTMADSLNHWNNAVYMPCDTMISIKGYTIVNNGEWYPIPTAGGGEDVWFYFSRSDNWLREKHNYDYISNQTCVLTVEYIK